MHRPNRLTLVLTSLFVVAGLVVGGLAVTRLLAEPGSDVAWVSVLLAVGLVLWGLDFAALGTRDDPDEDDDTPGAVSTRTELLTSGIVAALGYVLLRTAWDVPPLLSLLAVVVVVGIRTAERILRGRRGRGRPTAT